MIVLGNKLPGAGTVLANTTMFQMLMGFENVLYPYWTLLIEHFFYILCALLFVAGILHSAARMQYVAIASAAGIILLAMVLIAAPTMKYAKPEADLMYIASFLFAMIVGHNVRMAQGGDVRAVFTRVSILFVVVLALISVARIRVGGYSALLSPASVFISTVGALLVFLLALRQRAFTAGAFVYAGRISYGLYLFHGIALWVAIALVGKPADGLRHSCYSCSCSGWRYHLRRDIQSDRGTLHRDRQDYSPQGGSKCEPKGCDRGAGAARLPR